MTRTTTSTKQFYFANQLGVVIADVLSLEIAALIIAELKRQGFDYCYSLWVTR